MIHVMPLELHHSMHFPRNLSVTAENCYCLFTVKDVFECLDVYSLNHCMKILETVQDTFGDLPHLHNTHQLVTSEIPDLFYVTIGTRIF